MSSSERFVVLTIIKIFNWNQPHANHIFQLSFTSLRSNTPILTKTLKATISKEEAIFNYSLRVAYQPDENEVLPLPFRS